MSLPALQEDLATDELLLADGSGRDGGNRLAAIKVRTDKEWSNEGCGDDCSQRDDFALVHGVTRVTRGKTPPMHSICPTPPQGVKHLVAR